MSRRVIAAAERYMAGCRAKAQEAELSDRSLARKFECSRRAICKAADGQEVPGLSAGELKLIQSCVRERKRLTSENLYRPKELVAADHGVSVQSLNAQLNLMGWANPLTTRKGVSA